MLDARGLALHPKVQIAGGFGARDLRVERAPFCSRLAALNAKSLLNAHPALVRRPGVDRHVVRMNLLIADLLCGGVHDFEVVGGRQTRIAVAARDDQTPLRQLVVALQLLVRDGPVGQRCAGNLTVRRTDFDFPRTKPWSGAGPMHRSPADRLADPDRQCRGVLCHTPGAGGGPRIQPCQLPESGPRIL